MDCPSTFNLNFHLYLLRRHKITMNLKQFSLFVLPVILILLALPQTIAAAYYDTHGITLSSSAGSGNLCIGQVINITSNNSFITLDSIYQEIGGVATRWFIINDTWNNDTLNGAGIDNLCTIMYADTRLIYQGEGASGGIFNISTRNIKLYQNKNYAIMFDANGSSFTFNYGSVSYSKIGSSQNITYIKSVSTNTYDLTYLRQLKALSFSDIEPLPTPTISFESDTIPDGTTQYFESRFIINTTATNFGGSVNTTHYIHDSVGNVVFQNTTNSTNMTTNTNLSIAGIYYINATATNGTNTTSTNKRTINITYYNANLSVQMKNYLGTPIYPNGTINLTHPIFGTTSITFQNGTLNTPISKNTTYNIKIDAPSYAIYNASLTTNGTNQQYTNLTLYTNNSINIYIYDESTGFLIYDNITMTFTGLYEQINYTTTGTFYIDQLLDGVWTIKFQGSNYSLKQYTATVGSRSTQILNAYLGSLTSNTILTILDFDSSAVIEGATLTQQRLIGGVWTTINTKNSDITGRIQTSYIPLIKYRFIVVKTGYQTTTFDLDPVLFTSYNVRLTKLTTLTPPTTPAYTDMTKTYYPTNFTIHTNHTLTYIITSPGGQLITYNITITYPGGSLTDTGANLYGETITNTFPITTANITDRIKITTCWKTTTSYNNCETHQYTIRGIYGNLTFISNKDQTYGMGILERVIIASILIVFVGGAIYVFLSPAAGLLVILLLMGYFYYIGFLTLWIILPSLTIGLFMLFRGEK